MGTKTPALPSPDQKVEKNTKKKNWGIEPPQLTVNKRLSLMQALTEKLCGFHLLYTLSDTNNPAEKTNRPGFLTSLLNKAWSTSINS